ncbi:MAG: hypothetical protein ACK4UN_17390, partial [Limisphaerales bacterium]
WAIIVPPLRGSGSANQCVHPSADNVFSFPMKPLIYVSPGSTLGHAGRSLQIKLLMRNVAALVALLGMTLILSGCVMGPKAVSADSVPVYGGGTLYHTVYTGSDDRYHYFSWNRGWRGGQMKVDKTQLQLSCEFPRGTGFTFVVRKPDGTVDVR